MTSEAEEALRQEMARLRQRNEEMQAELDRRHRIAPAQPDDPALDVKRPDLDASSPSAARSESDRLERRLVWMFGSPRTGSSWLSRMLVGPSVYVWDEPYLGQFVGANHSARVDPETGFPIRWVDPTVDKLVASNLFHETQRPVWIHALRGFILELVRGRFDPRPDQRILVKEPNGSRGADVIMECLPNSRLIFLLRDPRDVIDSLMDLHRTDSWNPRPVLDTAQKREAKIREYARVWRLNVTMSQRAYDRHDPGRRLVVRYEDLRSDAAGELGRIHDFLGVEVPAAQVEDAVSRHAYENVPSESKGPGKAIRMAQPGYWRERFSETEAAVLDDALGEWIARLGY